MEGRHSPIGLMMPERIEQAAPRHTSVAVATTKRTIQPELAAIQKPPLRNVA